ncbi:hypothetical protein ACIA5D_02520 [Actinoplanes sp. NPDC051513]|uniref:hypothetical protein n=1 Tax=Actinoplanes sp. NPDC051513 TaxID=3363908 RepID=UPI0037920DFE
MESLPAAGTVRRTVRVAVALVVGQALLCALIGWLTLGRGHGSAATVDQMAAPPVPAPTATSRYATPAPTAATSATPPATAGRKTADRKVAATPSRANPPALDPPDPPAPAPPPPAPATAVPELPDPTIVVTTTTVPGRALVPPMPSPTLSEAPGPVTVGDRCLPEGAFARTADGDLVRCVRTWRHRSRWKIV